MHIFLKKMHVFLSRVDEALRSVFQPFFGLRHPLRLKNILRHPYLAKMTIWGTLSSKKFKKVVNSIFGDTPNTSSRHPGWEPLL